MSKKALSFSLILSLVLSLLPMTTGLAAETYVWPLIGNFTITSYFGNRTDPFTGEIEGHGAIDIGAPYGTPVYASSSGTLHIGFTGCEHNYAGSCSCGGGYGNYVYIDDVNGMRVFYAHLTSVTASAGYIEKGTQIGTVGSTGSSTGAHLHFEMRTGTSKSTRVDPLNYVSSSDQITITTATLSIDRADAKYGLSENVQFFYSAENATAMYLTFYKDGVRREDLDVNVTNVENICKSFSELGYYEVYLYAVTSNGDMESEKIGFNVLPMPSNIQLNIERKQYSMNEAVAFYYSAEDATAMYLTFYKDGKRREDLDVNVTNTNHTMVKFVESGYYEAFICAVNSYGQRDSSCIGVYIQPGPGNVRISTDKQIYNLGEKIEFSYSAENANEMYLTFYKDGVVRTDLDVNISGTNKKVLTLNEPGFYEAYICAVNSDGQTNSYTTWFSVVSSNTYTSTVYNGHTYVLFNTMTKWEDAKKECERLGGHLVTITSANEQQCMLNLISNGIKNAYWIGASEDLENNTYEWSNGEIFSYSNWDSNEPSNTNLLEHYAAVYKTTGKWNDFIYSGDYACGFICEFENEYQHIITYDSNGGNNAPSLQTKIYGKPLVLSDSIPKLNGYTFISWNTKADGTGISYNIGDTYTANESVTLYAQWEETISHIASVVTKSGTVHTVKTQLHNFVAPCDILVAGYKAGQFVTLKNVPYSQDNMTSTLTGDIDEIKVMVWEDLSLFSPLCAAEVIPSSAWAVE